MKPATAVSTRNGRVAFILGGSLFIASSVALALESDLLAPAGMTYMYGEQPYYTALFAAGVIVFAWGVRREGSVVARKPLGVVALSWFGLAPVVVFALMNFMPANLEAGSVVSTIVGVVTLVSWWGSPVAGVIGVFQIVRVRAVPGWWRWIPAIVFALGCIAYAVVFWRSYTLDQAILAQAFLFECAAPLLLGVPAIGLAASAHPRPVVPNEPASDPTAQ